MKRLLFFVAVFSTGLVILMISTGQLGKIFDNDSSPAETRESVQESSNSKNPHQNRITYPCVDLERGRERFTVSGIADNPSLNQQHWEEREQVFTDAWLDIPFAPENGAPSEHVFHLEAPRVHIAMKNRKARLAGRIVGTSPDGTRVEAEDLELSWEERKDGEESLILSSDRPIDVRYPALRAHGEGGIRGRMEGRQQGSTRTLSLLPPVVVSLTVDQARQLFGKNLTADIDGGKPDGDMLEAVILYSKEGPLEIDLEARTARFDRGVIAYKARIGPNTPLYPEPAQIGARLETQEIELQLEREKHNVARVEARARDGAPPVRAILDKDGVVEGKHLVWDKSDPDVQLLGGVCARKTGMEIQASEARIDLARRHAVLKEKITGEFRPASREGGAAVDAVAPDKPRPLTEHPLRLTCDEVEIDYDQPGGDATAREHIRRLLARSKRENQLVVEQLTANGIKLYGSRAEYVRESDLLRITGAQPGGKRPYLEMNGNEVVADEIDAAIGGRRVTLRNVDCRIASVPNEKGDLPSWVPDGKGTSTMAVRGEELTLDLAGERSQEIAAIRVVGDGKSPAQLRTRGLPEETFSVDADEILWQREPSEITLAGTHHPARLQFEGTEVRARKIYFNTETNVVRTDGECRLEGRAVRPGKSATADPVVLTCDHIEAVVDRMVEEKGDEVRPQSQLRSARAWSDGGAPLSVSFGHFSGEGTTLTWDGTEGILRLADGGRQRLFYLVEGQNERGEVSAETIALRPDDGIADLEGDVAGTIHLAAKNAREDGAAAAPTPWSFRAPRVHMLFSKDLASRQTEFENNGGERTGLGALPEPEELYATDHVILDQPADAIHVEGGAARWTQANQRLRIYSEDGKGRQTFQYGGKDRAEIVAREVSIVRVPGQEPRWNVLCDDVPDAVFQSSRAKTGGAIPGEFRVRADHALCVIEQSSARDADKVREALAWGKVLCEAGPYRVSADRCRFDGERGELIFYGEPVRVESGGGEPIKGDTVTLRKEASGYSLETEGRYPWDAGQLSRMVDLHRDIEGASKAGGK